MFAALTLKAGIYDRLIRRTQDFHRANRWSNDNLKRHRFIMVILNIFHDVDGYLYSECTLFHCNIIEFKCVPNESSVNIFTVQKLFCKDRSLFHESFVVIYSRGAPRKKTCLT